MFDSIGWGEIVVLALGALFIFGPERLPSLAKEAAGALRRVRVVVKDLRSQVDETLGDDFADLRELDLRRYHPKTRIRDHLLAEADETVPPIIRREAGVPAPDGAGRSAQSPAD